MHTANGTEKANFTVTLFRSRFPAQNAGPVYAHIVLAHRSFALWNALKFSYSPHFHSIFRPFVHAIRKILSYGFKFSPHTGQIDTLFLTISHLTVPELIIPILQYILTNINSNNGKEKTVLIKCLSANNK